MLARDSITRIVSSWFVSGLAVLGLTGCVAQEGPVADKASTLVAQPVVDQKRLLDDFGFPSQPPSLLMGKKVYQNNCLACHAVSTWQQKKVQDDLTFTTPIDYYLFLTRGQAAQVSHPSPERRQLLPAKHPAFRDNLTRDERWAAIFYTRYLAGASDIQYSSRDGKPLDVAAIYGGNCAVCHGKRGYADGPLHTGWASSHELARAKIHSGLFQPPPANFHEYRRLYNRTDAQMYKYIVQGLYPSGMPPWYGKVDKDYNFVFDDKLIWMLVRHERTFAYKNDLPPDVAAPAGPIPSYTVSREPSKNSNYQEIHGEDMSR